MLKNFLVLLAFSSLVLISCGGCGDGPTKPKNPPNIIVFQANPTDITPGDSSLITYQVSDAKSLSLTPPVATLSNVTSGSFYVKPSVPTEYILVAGNDIAVDSARIMITMATIMPEITNFSIDPEYALLGNPFTINWTTLRADSIRIDKGVGLKTEASGSAQVTPILNTTYTGIAYNQYGTDTAMVTAEIPEELRVVGEPYYKGMMGSATSTPSIVLQVVDAADVFCKKPWIVGEILEGDGSLMADSVQPGANDTAVFNYNFSGNLGHAVIRSLVRDVDTSLLYVRASTIIPGTACQGQYVKYRDSYGTIKAFDGDAERVDVVSLTPTQGILAAVYEQTQGVVVLVLESGTPNGIISTLDTAFMVLLTENYTGTSAEGVGIGSNYAALVAAYGTPDSSYYDEAYPDDTLLFYNKSQGMTFWCNRADTTVNQIDLYYPDEAAQASGRPEKYVKPEVLSRKRTYKVRLP